MHHAFIPKGGYYENTVIDTSRRVTEIETLGRELPYGYGSDSGGGHTAELLVYLRQRFGSVRSFSGSYRADRWRVNIQRSAGINYTNSSLMIELYKFLLLHLYDVNGV